MVVTMVVDSYAVYMADVVGPHTSRTSQLKRP